MVQGWGFFFFFKVTLGSAYFISQSYSLYLIQQSQGRSSKWEPGSRKFTGLCPTFCSACFQFVCLYFLYERSACIPTCHQNTPGIHLSASWKRLLSWHVFRRRLVRPGKDAHSVECDILRALTSHPLGRNIQFIFKVVTPALSYQMDTLGNF